MIRTFLIIFMFFAISALIIISNNNLALSQAKNLSSFSQFYQVWLNHVYSNVQTLTGDIVKLSWLPQ